MPTYIIDHSYRKDTKLPLGQGYSMRPGGIDPTAIVIHTTNNAKSTTFAFEAAYLRDSRNVGAHYVNGKQGQITEILSPRLAAWQAGGKQEDGTWTAQSAFDNSHSIGIENHVSIGEAWTVEQHDSLTWLVRYLMAQYHIPLEMIETHRKIALPIGRKQDPNGFPDVAFYGWRATLAAAANGALPPPPKKKRYRVRGIPVYESSSRSGPQWGMLKQDQIIEIDDLSNGHVFKVDGVPAEIGFIRFDPDTLEAL